jgi:hypothetical protein
MPDKYKSRDCNGSSHKAVCLCVHMRVRKVKLSHYGPGQNLRAPGVRGSQISRQSAHEDGKVVCPTHRPPSLPRKCSWYSFLLAADSTLLRPEGLCQWKIPMTSSGIEPATCWLVAQCFNQLRYACAYVPAENTGIGMDNQSFMA